MSLHINFTFSQEDFTAEYIQEEQHQSLAIFYESEDMDWAVELWYRAIESLLMGVQDIPESLKISHT